jgi:apolipoprotein N-acyltransferase
MATIKRNSIILYLLPVFSGVLLALAAIPSKIWYLSFIAFVPLLVASDFALLTKKPFRTFAIQLLITLVVFYGWVGFWIFRTANLGFIIGFLIVVPFVILVSPYILFIQKGRKYASVYFISAWLTAEFAQNYFQLGSPFFNLGHNPGAAPGLIQWYEYTGAAGGTLWILAVNFLIYSLGKSWFNDRKRIIRKALTALGVLLIPVAVSLIIFYTYREKGEKAEVLVVHPCTDNRDVKYQKNIYELMDIYLAIMREGLTPETQYVVLPETAITNAGWVADLNNNLVFDHFRDKTVGYPDLKLITGAITYKAIPEVERIAGYKKIPGIRFSEKYKTWYFTYNSALLVEKSAPVQIRIKDRLVPYQEYAPYPLLMPRIRPVGIDFQFSSHKNNSQVFKSEKSEKTAALLCYELVYSYLFRIAAHKKAELFFVLLNEGWYKDPKVPRQFLQLSSIRAIENRRGIAHSSNMGISAFIDQRGKVIARNESKSPGYLIHEMMMCSKLTLFSLIGNFLGFTALINFTVMIFRELIIRKK